MCGICGIIEASRSKEVDREELLRMRERMTHRGPDDAGMFFRGQVGLGQRRLSIIDVEGGHQPVPNEDETIWIVFNGEIYNYKVLQQDLIEAGHRFATNCDTEVLIHLYEEHGTEFLDKLQGMFSFAIWDSKRERLFVARDRLGIKPFYYFGSRERFVFASEIKAIFECRDVPRKVNRGRLAEYLVFRFVSGSETIFDGINSLLPGNALVWERGNLKIWQYWSVPLRDEEIEESSSVTLERLDSLLQTSVKRRLMSDVPLGTLNSGGIDSSLVTAYAAEMRADPINTYSVGFEEPEYDESAFAALISQKYGTNHHRLVVNGDQFARMFPVSLWYNDEPLNHANSVLISLICRLAKEKVTVLLTGEGADEVFGGYPRLWLLVLHQWLPLVVRKTIALTMSSLNGHYAAKLRAFLPMPSEKALLLNASFVLPEKVEAVLKVPSNFVFPFREGIAQKGAKEKRDLVRRGLYLDLHTYLVSILHRMDKMSMAAGVEARVPFLDHELVEFAARIPSRKKLSFPDLETKAILKKLAVKRLPRTIVRRKKSGFGVPVGEWLRKANGLGRYLCLLERKTFSDRDLFDLEAVRTMVKEHREGRRDHSEMLWEIINLEVWFNLFIDRVASEADAREFANDLLGPKAVS